MPGVKKLIVEKDKIYETILSLQKDGYHSVKVFLKGSREHDEIGLLPDRVLIKAWRHKVE
jgi:regulator of replication initiation timing